jgi:hypothetical protein
MPEGIPESKRDPTFHPVRWDDVSIQSLEKWIDLEKSGHCIEAKREIKSQAIRKLELLDELHRELVAKAHKILLQAQEDLRLHDIHINAAKIRGKLFHLYRSSNQGNREFFSILSPADYLRADAQAEFVASYRLNEDNTWTSVNSAV